MKVFYRVLFLCFFLVNLPLQAREFKPGGIFEVSDLAGPVKLAIELAKEKGPQGILVVFDLDNTLLTHRQVLGSVAWYDWQAEQLKSQSADARNLRAASDFPQLFDLLGKLYALGSMESTQDQIPQILGSLKNHKIASLILTARGPDYRSVSERELDRHQISFLDLAPGPKGGIAGRYKPYDETSAKTQHYFKQKPYKEPRLVSFMEGLYMTAGQHKGLMLSLLLERLKLSYSDIIFVDDDEKNVKAMLEGFPHNSPRIYGFRYGRMDEKNRKFHAKPDLAVSQWKKLSQVLNQIF